MAQFPLKFMMNGTILILILFFFPFVDGDVPRRTSYGVYITQLIRFAKASSNVSDVNCRKKALTSKLLKQGYSHYKLYKAFSNVYRRTVR